MPVLVLQLLLFLGIVFSPEAVFATSYSVDIVAHVAGCGDAIIQTGEECDGATLGGSTCNSLGFSSGALSCSTACTFITTSCSLEPPSTSGGTRARQSEEVSPVQANIVVFGNASPFSTVSLLKDGQRVATTPVKSDASFQITIANVGSGIHRLQLVVERLGFSPAVSEMVVVRVVDDATTKVGPVTLPPLVQYSTRDNRIFVQGYTIPMSTVDILKDARIQTSVISNSEGFFSGDVLAAVPGTYSVGIKMGDGTIIASSAFDIQEQSSPVVSPCLLIGDINKDCRVDAVDFFVTRFRWTEGILTERFDFNADGRSDIVDFSIMAFYWTG